jgi:hypothetical protein
MLKTKSFSYKINYFRSVIFDYRFLRQGCKGFSSFPAPFLARERTGAQRSPMQPDLPQVAEALEALAEGGALNKKQIPKQTKRLIEFI